MLRKIMIALTVLIAIGALSNNANARMVGGGHFHGGGGGHWHGGGGHWHGGWRGGGWGWGWPAAVGFGVGYGAGYYGAGYYGYGYPYYGGGCYRAVHVRTHYGWRWRRVWVCG